MRITVVSDLHLDARTAGVARHDDVAKALFEAVEYANEHASLFVCAGDICDPDSGSCVFRVLRTCVTALSRLKVPSIWIPGNHDVIEDGTGESTLDPLKALTHVIDRPGLCAIDGFATSFEFLAFPFTPLSHKYKPTDILKSACRVSERPRIVLGHLNVKGAQPGDEDSMVRGRDVWLPVKEIRAALGDVPIINGHIHKRQITKDGVTIPGSLERLTFGEQRHVTGWLDMVIE